MPKYKLHEFVCLINSEACELHALLSLGTQYDLAITKLDCGCIPVKVESSDRLMRVWWFMVYMHGPCFYSACVTVSIYNILNLLIYDQQVCL